MTKKLSKSLFAVGVFILILVIIFIGTGFFSKAETQAAEVPAYKYYKSIEIQSGDTLTAIANTYISDQYSDINSYIEEVESINGLTSTTIHAGQYLTVPYYSSELQE